MPSSEMLNLAQVQMLLRERCCGLLLTSAQGRRLVQLSGGRLAFSQWLACRIRVCHVLVNTQSTFSPHRWLHSSANSWLGFWASTGPQLCVLMSILHKTVLCKWTVVPRGV